MKNIEDVKLLLHKKYAKQFCDLDDVTKCSKATCECRLVAEINALKKSVLPVGFNRFTIRDFTGLDTGYGELLDADTTLAAKTKLSEYLYGKLDPSMIDAMSDEQLNKASHIDRRYNEGRNLVVSGDSKFDGDWGKKGGVTEKPIGRTFVAAVAMHEAIKLRARYGLHHLSYGWINFSSLAQSLRSDLNTAALYQSCDWLVVDNITSQWLRASDQTKAITCLQLDPFFASRLEQRLPTILVFKFDVRRAVGRLEDSFGSAVNTIVNDGQTCLISLGRREEE